MSLMNTFIYKVLKTVNLGETANSPKLLLLEDRGAHLHVLALNLHSVLAMMYRVRRCWNLSLLSFQAHPQEKTS